MTDVIPPTGTSTNKTCTATDGWIETCRADAVPVDRGVAVLVTADDQATESLPVALFRLSSTDPNAEEHEWCAVSHLDPATGAPIIARGLVGSVDGPASPIPTVASPLLKQRYDLRTGVCLDDASLNLEVFEVMVSNGRVWIRELQN